MKTRYSIRTIWYALIVLTTVAPILVFSLWGGPQIYSLRLENELLQKRQYNIEIKSHLEGELSRILTLLENKTDPVAHALQGGLDRNLIDTIFNMALAREMAVEFLALVDPQGAVIHEKTRPGVSKPRLITPQDPEMIIALHGRKHIGSIYVHDHARNFNFNLSVPVGPNDSPMAVLIASVDAEALWEEVYSKLNRPGVTAYVVDNRGRMMVNSPGVAVAAGGLATHIEAVRQMIALDEWYGKEAYTGINGARVFGMSNKVGGLGWGVISEIPEQVVLKPLWAELMKVVAIIAVRAVVFCGVGLLIIKYMLRPVDEMTAAYDTVAQGNFIRVGIKSYYKEIGHQIDGFNRMVSEIKQRESRIMESRRLFLAVASLSPVGIWRAGTGGNCIYLNERCREIAGLDNEEAAAGNWMRHIHPDDRERMQEIWTECVANQTGFKEKFRFKRPDGKTAWVLNEVVPEKNEAGVTVSFIGTVTDITDITAASEKIKAHTEELEKINGNLRDFAMIASHDLQEPLRKIASFSDRLKSCARNLDAESRDYLERIQKSALRMKALLDGLMSYSRLSAARPHEPSDLNGIVKSALETLEARLRETCGTVHMDGLPACLEVDAFQMEQLFQNLIGNSLKFHREGVPPVVRVQGRKVGGGHWEITVKDNGIGFDMQYAGKIFKPFERLHAKAVYPGAGIGLSICKKILENHGGKIAVTSVPNEGTAFVITLPEKSAAGHPAA